MRAECQFMQFYKTVNLQLKNLAYDDWSANMLCRTVSLNYAGLINQRGIKNTYIHENLKSHIFYRYLKPSALPLKMYSKKYTVIQWILTYFHLDIFFIRSLLRERSGL